MPGHLIRPLSGRMRLDILPGGRAEREKLNDLLVKQRNHHRVRELLIVLVTVPVLQKQVEQGLLYIFSYHLMLQQW